jgi:hypothetical protein
VPVHSLLSAHTWLLVVLAAAPCLIWIPLWLLDADREPDNALRQEQDGSEKREREPDLGELTAAA